MNLLINGEPRVFSAESVDALVDQLGMKSDRVAIELNRDIVPRDQWAKTALKDGDRAFCGWREQARARPPLRGVALCGKI